MKNEKKITSPVRKKRRTPGQTVRRIVQKFCEGCIDFVHEIEYNKFELIFIYHSLYNLQDVSGKQKADETDGRGEKRGQRRPYYAFII